MKISPVGLDRFVRLAWLEHSTRLLLAGSSTPNVRAALHESLAEELPSSNGRGGARDKTVGILMKIWAEVPPPLRALRDEGLEHARRLPSSEHLALHWGMTLAAYPFFGVVTETLGRLLRLQGAVDSSQIQRRLREQMGQRQTVERALLRALQTLADWGALCDARPQLDGKAQGKIQIWEATSARPVRDAALGAWLLEAALRGSGAASGGLEKLARSPSLFPFELNVLDARPFETNERVEVLVQGMHQHILALRLERALPPSAKKTSKTPRTEAAPELAQPALLVSV